METLELLFPGYLAASPVIVPIGVNHVVVHPVVVHSVYFVLFLCVMCVLCILCVIGQLKSQ